MEGPSPPTRLNGVVFWPTPNATHEDQQHLQQLYRDFVAYLKKQDYHVEELAAPLDRPQDFSVPVLAGSALAIGSLGTLVLVFLVGIVYYRVLTSRRRRQKMLSRKKKTPNSHGKKPPVPPGPERASEGTDGVLKGPEGEWYSEITPSTLSIVQHGNDA